MTFRHLVPFVNDLKSWKFKNMVFWLLLEKVNFYNSPRVSVQSFAQFWLKAGIGMDFI